MVVAKFKGNMRREQAILKRAQYLRSQDWPWTDIADELGVGDEWLRRRVEPGRREAMNGYAAKFRNKKLEPNSHRVLRGHRTQREIAEEAFSNLGQAIEDTRTFTQRFFGDPLPGRSALDRKMRGKQC